MRVVLYTGKGGVGKTTTAAATAVAAAARGRRTLVLSADPAHSLGDVLGVRLTPTPLRVAGRLDALEVDARAAMEAHWGRVRDWLAALFRHQGIEEEVAEELALLPGAEELAALVALEEHARSGHYDLLVVDCAPTGSTLRLVTLPEVARGSLRLLLHIERALASVVTPLARFVVPVPLPEGGVFREAERLLYRRLRAVRRLLTGPGTSVRLVVTPERVVVEEARRAHMELAVFELACDAVVLNRLLPEPARAEPFFRDWARVEAEREREIEALFAPLPVLRGPLQEDEVTGLERLAAHGAALFEGRAPEDLLAPRASGLRFVREASGYRVEFPLPHADPSRLDVAKVDGVLVVRAGTGRRRIPLPRRLVPWELADVRLAHERLIVSLRPPASAAS